MWSRFYDEIMETSKYQSGGKKERFANIGQYSEKIVTLKMRYNRLSRFQDLLANAPYLPEHITSQMVIQNPNQF